MDQVLAGMVEPTQTGIYLKKRKEKRLIINEKVKSRKRKICEGTG